MIIVNIEDGQNAGIVSRMSEEEFFGQTESFTDLNDFLRQAGQRPVIVTLTDVPNVKDGVQDYFIKQTICNFDKEEITVKLREYNQPSDILKK